MSYKAWTYPEQQDLMRLWNDGSLSLLDIAARLGRTEASVQSRGRNLNLPNRSVIRRGWTKPKKQKAA